jgi:putative SOS response-associated peptidase YedK
MKANPMIKTLHDKKKVVLDLKNTENYINGVAFAHYLLVLKHVLSKVN